MSNTENDWIFEAIYAFFQSARWQTPVQSFIEANCVLFLGLEDEKADLAKEHKDIHGEFKKLIDGLMQSLLGDIGINQKQFLLACQQAKQNKDHWKIVKQILLVEDFNEFKKIMVKRNKDLERKALSLMLQNEERSLNKFMEKNNIQGKGATAQKESSSEESSEEYDEEEHMRKAIAESEQQFKMEQNGGMQGMAMSTDGFNQMLKAGMQASEATAQVQTQGKKHQDNSEEQEMLMAMQLSEQTAKLEEAKLSEEEMQMKLGMMQSKNYHDNQKALEEKNKELLQMMQKIEDEKPEGWGFKKEGVEDKGDALVDYQHNFNKALKRIEMDEKRRNYTQKGKEEAVSSDQILADTKAKEDESMEERKMRLQEYKDKMIEARNAERRDELMRTSFSQVQEGKSMAEKQLDEQKQQQANKLEEVLAKRNKMRATALGFGKKQEQKKEESDDDNDGQPLVQDDYEGVDIKVKKQDTVLDLDERPKILDGDFMGALKLDLAEVPDSDDECYF